MPISDLTNTTWVINETPNALTEEVWYDVVIDTATLSNLGGLILIPAHYDDEYLPPQNVPDTICYDNYGLIVYEAGTGWTNSEYRTITIIGGTDATNSDLIAWLEANAVQQVQPSSSGSIKYGELDISKMYWGDAEVSKVYYGNTLVYQAGGEPVSSYITFSSPSSFTLNVANNKKHWNGTLEYSTDTETWNIWDGATVLSSSSSGNTAYLYLRGSNNTVITGAESSSFRWVLTGSNISCFGNIENLLDYLAVKNGNHPIMGSYCYSCLFSYNSSLTNISNLILDAITLTEGCYSYLFNHCESLTEALELPATTLAPRCYSSMFSSCTSLVVPPNLNATTLANRCYSGMFLTCTNLAQIPALPATILAPYCYSAMFRGCTKLTGMLTLPAATLTEGCYYGMFLDCTALTAAPTLPATTLADSCYYQMFNGCTSLAITPELPATTLVNNCYYDMFGNTNVLPDCTNIDFTSQSVLASGGLKGLFANTKITDEQLRQVLPINSTTNKPWLPATTLANNCYQSMFYRCTYLITAPELPATTLAKQCYDSMFYGCTSLEVSPELSATTLADTCYSNMFSGCTSLMAAPELPATTLTISCYSNMFLNCTSLIIPAKMAGGTTQATPAQFCCSQMYYGCSSLNIYTSSSGHTAFYKSITYSASSSTSNYRSSERMFYNCYINGTKSTASYLTAGTQFYY